MDSKMTFGPKSTYMQGKHFCLCYSAMHIGQHMSAPIAELNLVVPTKRCKHFYVLRMSVYPL